MRSVSASFRVQASRVSLVALGFVFSSACSPDAPTRGQAPGSGGSQSSGGQAGATSGGAASGGVGTGGATGGAGGISSGGASGGASGGSGGAAGGSGGSAGGTAAWACPAGPFEAPTLGGTATRVAGVPPPDAFNMNDGNFGNIEGPVWFNDALYVSEMSYMTYPEVPGQRANMARVLKVTGAVVEIAIADSGSNGLAIDTMGNLVAGVHKDGSVSRLSLAGGAAVPIVSMYMGTRFNSPNDLAVRSDGNIYFTDPSHQAPTTTIPTRLYRIAPGASEATAIEELQQPNGVTLSPDQNTLYVAGNQLRKYPVMADGSLGSGSNFLMNGQGSGDGMVVDCAGNLYVAGVNQAASVDVYSPTGTSLGSISAPGLQSATNVAFGGPDRKTLYITGLGNDKGLFQITMNVPGFPY